MMRTNRVVVTGLGALTPIGNNAQEYWASLFRGESGGAPITRFDSTDFSTRFACELKNFQSENYLDKKIIKKTDLCSQYALIACEEASKDAGLLSATVAPERIGVVWATGLGGLESTTSYITTWSARKRPDTMNPFFIPKMLADMPAGHIAIRYGFQGPNYAPVASCSSANHALINATHLIQLGHADIILSGGSEAPIHASSISGFGAMKALSTRNTNPRAASRPFDKDRDGFVMGEGAGALVLESYESAQRRGAKIYAEIIGTGMAADAYHSVTPHPDGRGIALAMNNTLKNAHIEPAYVDYINAHGTSTTLGDESEAIAIQQVFGKAAYNLNISATKSMTGHLLGAAGAIEAIACIGALQQQRIPPTINYYARDPSIDSRLNFTFNNSQSRTVSIALSNSSGFGGHNACVAFSKEEICCGA